MKLEYQSLVEQLDHDQFNGLSNVVTNNISGDGVFAMIWGSLMLATPIGDVAAEFDLFIALDFRPNSGAINEELT